MPCFGLVFFMWCAPPAAAPVDSYCAIAEPIYWAAADTRSTKVQVDRENAKGKRACGWGKKKG
jgi:hypothetical protein